MGFFGKLKQGLGIGGVDVNLIVDARIPKDQGNVSGKVELTTKNELHLLDLEIKMVKEHSTGKGEDKKTETFELGKTRLQLNRDIKPGETQTVDFDLPFAAMLSNSDALKELGGTLGTLGKISAFATNEKSVYYIKADMDVKGVALDPSDKKPIQLV